MTETLEAVFDGTVFRPQKPVKLKPNTRVQITVDSGDSNVNDEPEVSEKPDYSKPGSFLQLAETLKISGPTDMSSRLDEYLYQGATLDDGTKLNDDE